MKLVALFCLAIVSVHPLGAQAQCRNGRCFAPSTKVVRQVVKQPVVSSVVAQPVYYQVGQHLQQSAVATAQLRASEEYQELQRLRGFREAVEILAQQNMAAGAVGGPMAQELPPPISEPHASKFPRIVASCSKCHTGETPKGDVWLDGSVNLLDPSHVGLRDRIMRVTYNGHMPPENPLDDETFGIIVSELYAERSEEESP